MRRPIQFAAITFALASVAVSQQPATTPASQPFVVGTPLKPTPNVKTYGGFRFAERDLYIAVNAGMPQEVVPNDGYVNLVNPDGTAHTLKWIGVTRNGLTLNHPLGSVTVPGASRFNDLDVAADGTIYTTQTGDQNADTWRLYKITAKGESSIMVQGAPLRQPNGVAFDQKGNIVVVNIGSTDVLTFSPAGQLLTTETSVDAGNDGIAILPDGTKYVSSVRQGTVARIPPGQKAELIASGIPSAASMTYDPKRNRLVIPMNDWNAITFVELGGAAR